jgi:hypothetical protein
MNRSVQFNSGCCVSRLGGVYAEADSLTKRR